MKALLRLLRNLMPPQRVWPWICGFGALLAWLTVELGRHRRFGTLGGLSFVLLIIPFIRAPLRFRRMISNRRLALLPGFRIRAGLALLVVAAHALIAFSLLLYIELPDSSWEFVAVKFVWVTSFLLGGQWLAGQRNGESLYILPFLFASMLDWLPGVRAALRMPTVVLSGVALALVAWVWTFHWLRGARTIGGEARGRKSSYSAQPDWLLSRFNFSGLRAAGTLLRGRADDWRSPLVGQVTFLAGIPLFILFGVAVLRFVRSGASTFPVERPELLLFGSLVGGIQLSFFSRDWLPRARLLWLRLEGDRARIWRQVERLIVEEIGLALGVAAMYAVLLLGLTQLTLGQALAFVLASGACIGCSIYLTQWLRLLGWHIRALPGAVMAMMFGFGVVHSVLRHREPVAGSVSGSSQLGLTLTLCALAFALSGVALALRHSARNRFLRVDWCQLRPTAANEV